MYYIFDGTEIVNCISGVDTGFLKDEVSKGRIICKSPDLTQANVDAAYDDFRRELYAEAADPIFFKSERGQGTRQDWLNARDAIAVAYPTPTI